MTEPKVTLEDIKIAIKDVVENHCDLIILKPSFKVEIDDDSCLEVEENYND